MVWLLIGYMWLFIHRPFEIWPVLGIVNLERIYIAVCVLATALADRKGPANVYLRLPLAGFAAAILVSWWSSPYGRFEYGDKAVMDWLKIAVFFLLLTTNVRSSEDLKRLLTGYVAIMAIYLLHSTWEYYCGGYQVRMGIRRMAGVNTTLGGNPNGLAGQTALALPLAAALWHVYPTPSARRALLLFGLLAGYVIIQTGSRSGLVLVVVQVLLWCLGARAKIKSLLLVCLLAPCVWFAMPAEKQHRFLSLVDPTQGPANAQISADSRAEHWKIGLSLFEKNTFTGAGPASFTIATAQRGDSLRAHHLYGQLLGELGLVGTLAFVVLVMSIWLSMTALLRDSRHIPREQWQISEFTAWATRHSIILLLISGFGGLDAFRFNIVWLAAFAAVARHSADPSIHAQSGEFGTRCAASTASIGVPALL